LCLHDNSNKPNRYKNNPSDAVVPARGARVKIEARVEGSWEKRG